MGRHRCLCSSGSSSSSSSPDSAEPQLLVNRYLAANIADGLGHRRLRAAAVAELQEIFDQGLYSSSDKKVQQAIFEHLLVAAQQRDSRVQVRQAISSLLSTAKRVLPQQKRQQLVKAEKQAALAANRAARKEAAGGQSSAGSACVSDGCEEEEEEEGEAQVLLSDVPLEVVAVILQSLDPLSLAAAACVCRSWYQLAVCDECWQVHLQEVFPKAAAKRKHKHQHMLWPAQECGQQQQQGQTAAAAAAAAPATAGGPKGVGQPGCAGPLQTHTAAAAAGGSGGDCEAAGGVHDGGGSGFDPAPHRCIYRHFADQARRHPSALLPWRSCRTLLACPPTVRWCLPASAPELTITIPLRMEAAAGARQAGPSISALPAGQGAAAAAAATASDQGAARSSTAKRIGELAPPVLSVHRHWAGTGARPGLLTPPLTAKQVVGWMTGKRPSQLSALCEESDDSDSGFTSSGSDESDGDESHTAGARGALRLWSIGR